jgi:hypothetical protein
MSLTAKEDRTFSSNFTVNPDYTTPRIKSNGQCGYFCYEEIRWPDDIMIAI